MGDGLPWDNNSWQVAAQIAARRRQNFTAVVDSTPGWLGPIGTPEGPLTLRAQSLGQLLLQTTIVPVSRSRQFDGREIEIIDGLPDWSSRTSVGTAGTGTGKPRGSP